MSAVGAAGGISIVPPAVCTLPTTNVDNIEADLVGCLV
jgi:hypothetical protein